MDFVIYYMNDYYCDICDKVLNRRSKASHMRSKNHLNMSSYVRNKARCWQCFLGGFSINY